MATFTALAKINSTKCFHNILVEILLLQTFSSIYGIVLCIIWGEPEQAPNTRETGSGVYLFIYLYVILHGNDLMRMLKHHV